MSDLPTAAAVRAAIKAHGTQKALAEKLNVDRVAVTHWATAGEVPLKRLTEFCAVCGGRPSDYNAVAGRLLRLDKRGSDE